MGVSKSAMGVILSVSRRTERKALTQHAITAMTIKNQEGDKVGFFINHIFHLT